MFEILERIIGVIGEVVVWASRHPDVIKKGFIFVKALIEATKA